MPSPDLDLHGTVVTAVLGPTNTGKTWQAIQRMLGHRTGMIGLPLRLLAREVYERVVEARGPDVVALVTGEERIVPPGARYWVATVEAMPLEQPVAFVAVDEIQLCTHPTRGHVFTDRLLHARGAVETMFMGSDTMAPFIARLLPTAELKTRPRLSTLRASGPHRLTALPRRTAVVAFGATRVYELAERLRSRHGGAAVVLGSLSPRARNAQVAMYQSGEVPYMVATDAIGMGLNLDLDHVAFSSLQKFDGRQVRELQADELAQIAGRAGRYKKDGTFGLLDELPPMPPDLVEAIEQHRFPPVHRVWWRNSELDFRSPQHLLDSLERPAPSRVFQRMLDAIDHEALRALATREHVRRRVRGPEATELLWRVCQVPDYRNSLTEAHVELLDQLHSWLSGPTGRVPEDEIARRVRRLDRPEGDFETLMSRLAWIRTWTYIAHRSDWVEDPRGWQARTLAVEERLSDALHEQLRARFVDRRTRLLGSGDGPRAVAPPEVEADGSVRVLDQRVGQLRGFDLVPDPRGMPVEEPQFEREVRRLLEPVVQARLQALLDGPDDAFEADAEGRVSWQGHAVGQLVKGESLWSPRVRPLRLDLLSAAQRDQVGLRLGRWRDALVERVRRPLHRGPETTLDRPGRGVHYQVTEGLGSVPREAVEGLVRELSEEDRKRLARLGIRLGQHHVYAAGLLGPREILARGELWRAFHGDRLPDRLPEGTSTPRQPGIHPRTYAAMGYAVLGDRAVRHDALERVSAWARQSSRSGPFVLTPEPMEWLGCPRAELPGVLRDLGYVPADGEGERWTRQGAGRPSGRRGGSGPRRDRGGRGR